MKKLFIESIFGLDQKEQYLLATMTHTITFLVAFEFFYCFFLLFFCFKPLSSTSDWKEENSVI